MQTDMHPLEPGQRAPGFILPAANREGTVSLEAYRGRRAVLIGFFRGLHCPFCRRQAVELGRAQPELAELGVETLAVFNTLPERARLYFRYHPTSAIVLADPDCAVHRAFGVPEVGLVAAGSSTPTEWPHRTRPEDFEALRIDPTGEMGESLSPMEGNLRLNAKDAFEMSDVDKDIFARHGMQLSGHFLVDREGIVRWARSEATRPPGDLCRFPTAKEMLAAARSLGQQTMR
jgi:peroxiredoxin